MSNSNNNNNKQTTVTATDAWAVAVDTEDAFVVAIDITFAPEVSVVAVLRAAFVCVLLLVPTT